MRKISNEQRIDEIFMLEPSTEALRLFQRAELILKTRNLQTGTQPAKRGRKPKDKPAPLIAEAS